MPRDFKAARPEEGKLEVYNATKGYWELVMERECARVKRPGR